MSKFDLHFTNKDTGIMTILEFDLKKNATAAADRLLSYAGELKFKSILDGAVMRAENSVYNVHIVKGS